MAELLADGATSKLVHALAVAKLETRIQVARAIKHNLMAAIDRSAERAHSDPDWLALVQEALRETRRVDEYERKAQSRRWKALRELA